MNGNNKFATGQILKKSVEIGKGRIWAGWAQKSPESWIRTIYKPLQIYNVNGLMGLNESVRFQPNFDFRLPRVRLRKGRAGRDLMLLPLLWVGGANL